MDLIHFKVVLLINGWVLAKGSPVAMLQHATSSQSIVFHTDLSEPSTIPKSSSAEQYGTRQPKYEYKYEVSDHQTGDRKSHWESREGDRVRGVYSLYEPDGALRTVEYTADATHGFNAIVKRNEPSKHQLPGQAPFSHSSNNKINQNYLLEGQKTDRNIFSSNPRNREEPDHSGTKSLYNSGVNFSVSHVLKKFRDNDNLY